jgi:phosphotransferase system  glucose/maltose/N-acetylglucosamine-specific IIC component
MAVFTVLAAAVAVTQVRLRNGVVVLAAAVLFVLWPPAVHVHSHQLA